MPRLRSAALVAALAALPIPLVGAGSAAAETSPPVIQSFAIVGPTTVDTTLGWGWVTVRARVTDVGRGVYWVSGVGTYTRDASAHPASLPSGWSNGTGAFTRISGSEEDGIYEGRVSAYHGTRGTWSIELEAIDRDENTTRLTSQQLAAKGGPSTFKSTVSGPPVAPKIQSRVTYFRQLDPHINAVIWLGAPAGTPIANGAIRVRANAACGRPWANGPSAESDDFTDKRFLQTCTVTYRTVNAAGASPEATHSFW